MLDDFLQELKLEASRLCCVSEKKSILLQKGNGDLCNFTLSRFMAELHEQWEKIVFIKINY